MKKDIHEEKWRCIGESVRGASHLRSGLPNQDAIQWYPGYPETGIGLPVVLAVSDGHGSAKSFRSDKGSQFAVSTAIRVIQEFFLTTQKSDINFPTLKDGTERLLPQRLVNEWRKIVQQHLQEYPFTDEEKENLVKKDGESAWKSVENNNFLVYGATLLAVLVTESFILYIQLGDGDILEVNSQGETTRILERDPKLIANETTSLCMNKAWNEFQVHLEPYTKGMSRKMPALILVSTDGYSNSFSTDEGFFKIGKDYLNMFKSNSAENVREQIPVFLKETSEKGSGDDITLGIIKRPEINDLDYLPDILENLDKKVTLVEDLNVRQKESISDIESNMRRLQASEITVKNKIAVAIIGLIITFPLTLVNILFSIHLSSRLAIVEGKGLKQQEKADAGLRNLESSQRKQPLRVDKNE